MSNVGQWKYPVRFRTRLVEIDAVRVSVDNQMEVALWCGGEAGEDGTVKVRTMEGMMSADPGDWVVKGDGGYHPCRADVFAEKYELVGDDDG